MLTPKLRDAAGSHAWAKGCDHCRHGIMNAPVLNALSTNSLYVQRAIQAANHDIDFCECKAGVHLRIYLRKVWVGELQGREIPDDVPVPTIHFETPLVVAPVKPGGAAYA